MLKPIGILVLFAALLSVLHSAQAAFTPQVFSCQDSDATLSVQILVSPDTHGGIADIHLIQDQDVLRGHIEALPSTPGAPAPKGGEITFETETGSESSPSHSGQVKIEVKRFQSLTQNGLLSSKTLSVLYRDEAHPDSPTLLSCSRTEE